MENESVWVTYVHLFATLAALFLAVFMPSIQKAADRRDTHLAVIKIFCLAIDEINVHLTAMEKTLRKRLVESEKGESISHIAVTKIMEELEYMLKSQTTVMNSVAAVDLPHPAMVTIAAIFERSVVQMSTTVIQEAEKNSSINVVLAAYLQEKSDMNIVAEETLAVLKQIKEETGPHPIVKIFSFLIRKKSSGRLQ